MRKGEQLKKDFALCVEEIDRCEQTKCYEALVHILLALPDVCASLEIDRARPGRSPEPGTSLGATPIRHAAPPRAIRCWRIEATARAIGELTRIGCERYPVDD